MIKKILIILFVIILIVNNSYSQSFTYKKCHTVGEGFSYGVIKTKGQIYVSDTMITIITKATILTPKSRVDYPIKVTTKKENFLQARAILDTEEYSMRFTLKENVSDNKKEKYTLLVETQDNSRGQITSITYFLIPSDINIH